MGRSSGVGTVSRPIVCSIGTTEPWNAAGLGLDLLALRECGVRPVSVVVGVSAQDETGIRALVAIPPGAIAAQFHSLGALEIAACRIGAILDVVSVEAVARALWDGPPVVYDPVLSATAGGRFADDETCAAIRSVLVPRVRVLTPNTAEAERLLGSPIAPTPSGRAAAAQALRSLGAEAVLITGGDLAGAPVDLLADRDGLVEFEEPRIPGTMRGTGCLLAAALAAGLARGDDLRSAVRAARSFVRTKLAAATQLGPLRVAYE